MEIITAGDGTAHVSSADDGAIYAGIMGQECYVTGIGDKLSCTMQSANKALIGTGVGCMYGRMLRVTVPEEVTIESGAQNQRRNDIICARFTTSAEGEESGGLVVVKGTPTSDPEAEDPEIPGGNILEGATEAYMPLWRIPIDGINAGDPEPLFSVLLPMAEIQADVEELRDSVSQAPAVYPGTKLFTFNGGSGTLFTSSEIEEVIGRAFSNETDFVSAMNGDRQAVQYLIAGTWFNPETGNVGALIDETASGAMRVNYLIVAGR